MSSNPPGVPFSVPQPHTAHSASDPLKVRFQIADYPMGLPARWFYASVDRELEGNSVMKSWKVLVFLGLLLSAGVWAQGVTQITIGTSMPGVTFLVDGTSYTSTQIFLWPLGSEHNVQFLFSVDPNTGENLGYQAVAGNTAHYAFNGWTANSGNFTENTSPIISLTASRNGKLVPAVK